MVYNTKGELCLAVLNELQKERGKTNIKIGSKDDINLNQMIAMEIRGSGKSQRIF